MGRNYVPFIHLHYPCANVRIPPAAASETDQRGRAVTSVHAGHSPSHVPGSSGPGDSRGWAAVTVKAGPALRREAPPQGQTTSLLIPGSRKGLKARSASPHTSHQARATSPAQAGAGLHQPPTVSCAALPSGGHRGLHVAELGKQEAKGFRACLRRPQT